MIYGYRIFMRIDILTDIEIRLTPVEPGAPYGLLAS